jgi:hypothetical protein
MPKQSHFLSRAKRRSEGLETGAAPVAAEQAMGQNFASKLCTLLLCLAETAVAEPVSLNSQQLGSVELVVKQHLRDPVKAKDGSLLICGLVNAKNGSNGYTGFYPFMVGKGPPAIATSEVSAMLVLTACRAADIELRP